MTGFRTDKMKETYVGKEKILLALLPFWPPQIPPLGIACLKGFLRAQGFKVKTVDANIEEAFNEIDNKYFDTLKEYVPENKRGNFYNIGQDVLRNHMMAHLNKKNEKEYLDLVKLIIYNTFYTPVDDDRVLQLNRVLSEFYKRLENYIFDLLGKEKPTLLGLSVNRGNLPASLFTFKQTRKKYPQIKTVMGGPVFAQSLCKGTSDFDYFLKKTRDYIDKIIIGEGEHLFLKLLQGELSESRRVHTVEEINNEILDLSTVDIPDFSDLKLRFYPNLAAYTSRSCPFQCSFCSETVYWGKYRKKPAGQIVDELTRLYTKHNHQLFLMCDSLLNPVVDEVAETFINSDDSIYWDGYLRIDKNTCDSEKVLRWRRGGLYRARLGIESGSPHVLEAMGKKIPIKQIKASISTLAHAGIKTTTYWVIGHPGETEEDFLLTLDMLEELKDDIFEAWCSPFNYYLTGQVKSRQWAEKSTLLYPRDAKDMLVVQTWVLDCMPSREQAYARMNRFVAHCSKLGIPNPYSLIDFYKADERWKELHKNAVPPLVDFENSHIYIDENKKVKHLVTAQKKLSDDLSFGF
jgi:radical SAM superfamily enzyme YgiQ (UPF0313 family)